MATRIKQDRSRKSGHKHSLNAQDYASGHWSTQRVARANLETAMIMLTSQPVVKTLKNHPTLECAVREVCALMSMLGE